MDAREAERRERFLQLFGLRSDYSAEELAASYRTLAKLNHPDLNRDITSDMRMVIVNEGYEFLKAQLELPIDEAARAGKTDDPYYREYKNAFEILRLAFDDYFGEGEDKSRAGDLAVLRERLSLAKRGFSRLVTVLPYNPWVDDAIDKINSINKWLY